jgi:hypothetical protein
VGWDYLPYFFPKQPKKIPLFNCFIQFKNALKLCPFTAHLYGCTEVLTSSNTKNIFVIGGTPIVAK